MRICIAAENASRRLGGEAILPYQYFRVLRSRGIDTWLVVHARSREELYALFPDALDRMIFIEDLAMQRILFNFSKLLPRRVSESTVELATQLITQFGQRKAILNLIRENAIDVIHQPIPVAPRFPSLLYSLKKPVVVGPLNGGMNYPQGFGASESIFSHMFVAVARSLSNIVNLLVPGKRRADIILVANKRTREALPSGMRGLILEMPEVGVNLAEWRRSSGRSKSKPPMFVFIGRLVDWKALDIVMRALANITEAHLDVIGDGPMRAEWVALAAQLSIAERVHFLGWKSQTEYANHIDDSVALVLPSVYECGGSVVIEAMAMGKPVIATKWGGPENSLDTTCGVLVEPNSPQALISGFTEAMQRLIDSPELCEQLGSAGWKRITKIYDWDKKIDEVILIYDSLISQSK